ncbi:GH32 C-terminal domain-containing protein [Methyloprofundus sedimenti]|uniref:GH32 C-terminal domain-containing protein n=1 Tax=Methyloprofundus sedimenti TaxID=1420851 RepID=UPI001301FF41
MIQGRVSAPLISVDEHLQFSIFLHQSYVDVFAHRAQLGLSSRIFPVTPLLGVHLYSKEGDVGLDLVKVHYLQSVWQLDK